MSEDFGQKALDWVIVHKDNIAVGVICGLIGVVYGASKGVSITNKIWMRGSRKFH